MPGTVEVDRYRTDSGLWCSLTGRRQARKFMSRMDLGCVKNKRFSEPSRRASHLGFSIMFELFQDVADCSVAFHPCE